MVLTDQLRALSDADLADLFRHRPDLAAAAERGFGAVARRAGTAHSLGRLLVRSDVGMLVAAEGVCAAPGAELGELAELIGTDDPDGLLDAVDRLRRRGAVVVEGGRLHPVGQLVELFPYPFGLGRPVAELARSSATSELRFVLDRIGGTTDGGHGELLEHLADSLADRHVVHRVIDGLPGDAAALACRLVERRMPLVEMPVRVQHDPEDARTRLVRAGLLHPIGHERAELAREVSIALAEDGLAPDTSFRPPRPPRHPAADRSRIDAEAATAAARTLAAVEQLVDHVTDEPAALRRDRTLGIRELKRLAKLLGFEVHDAARLIEVAVAAELLVPEDAVVLAGPGAGAWLDAERHRRWTTLVQAWLESDRLFSLSAAPADDGRPRPALAPSVEPIDVRSARSDLLRVLDDLDDGEAIDRDSIWTLASWFAPNRWGGRSLPVDRTVEWLLAEAELLGLLAADAPSSALAPAARYDDLELDEVAARLLPADESRIVVQSDLTAVAFGALEPRVAATLSEMADRERVDGATTFRFSEASVRRAFDRGWRADELLEFLGARAVSGVPQSLEYLVGDVARRHGHLRVRDVGCVVIAADEVLASEVIHHRRVRALRLEVVAPGVLTSPLGSADVLDGLRAAGYLPTGDADLVRLERQAESEEAIRRPARLALPRLEPGIGHDEADELVGLLRDIDADDGTAAAHSPPAMAERAEDLRGRRATVRWFDGQELAEVTGVVALVVPDGLVLVASSEGGEDDHVVHLGFDDVLEIEEAP